MICYRKGGCGPYEMYPCNECPASKPEYNQRKDTEERKKTDPISSLLDSFLTTGKRCPLCKSPFSVTYPIKIRNMQNRKLIKTNSFVRKGKQFDLCPNCFAMVIYVEYLKDGKYELVLDEDEENDENLL